MTKADGQQQRNNKPTTGSERESSNLSNVALFLCIY
jgi:hypothetical protein